MNCLVSFGYNCCMALEAAHYQEARDRLAADPIVVAMANQIPDEVLAELTHADGTVTHDFMSNSNDEYARRGGRDFAHLGAVAEAIVQIKTA